MNHQQEPVRVHGTYTLTVGRESRVVGDYTATFTRSSLSSMASGVCIYICASLSEISDDAFLTSHFFLSLSGANDAAQQIAPRSKNHGWDARFVDARG